MLRKRRRRGTCLKERRRTREIGRKTRRKEERLGDGDGGEDEEADEEGPKGIYLLKMLQLLFFLAISKCLKMTKKS